MRTQTMPEHALGLAWLEAYSAEGDAVERTPVDPFPFVIGRDESATMQIPSNRVSREHAAIVREGNGHRVKDLGSTNGTFVNGRRIETAVLSDGDILTVADVELSFVCSRAAQRQDTVTQVIAPAGPDDGEENVALGVVRGVRHLHEMILHGCFENLFQPVVDLQSGGVVGYEVLSDQDLDTAGRSAAERLLLTADCRLTTRLRQLRRMSAIEAAAAFPGELLLFLKLDASEIGAAWLADSLGALRARLAPEQRLVIEVPDSAVSNTPYTRDFRSYLREREIAIAHDGFAGSASQLKNMSGVSPHFLKLAPSLVRGIHRNHQCRGQIQGIVRAAREGGFEVIAVGIRVAEESAALGKLGCRFGQGPFYGDAQPQTFWLAAGRPTAPHNDDREVVAPCSKP
jgi:EAL domain-containing protein (putative c-di-GMP-specific phosphodiesterase class I)